MARKPYPLQWPETAKRTPLGARERSRFGPKGRGEVSVFAAAVDVRRELNLLGAGNSIITSMLPTRSDGLPYADGGRVQHDPGIAVWFELAGDEMVFACDRWATAGENLWAISLSINAMRGLERWGMADVVNRAFAGFKALPPGSAGTMPAGPPPWREVLGGAWPPDLDKADQLAIAKARYRAAIAKSHPDAGGSHELAASLNAAIAAAELELGAIA